MVAVCTLHNSHVRLKWNFGIMLTNGRWRMGEFFAKGDWRIVIHEAEEGGYWGEIPAMPGCASDGPTVEEGRANVIEAAQGCLLAQFKWALSKAAKESASDTRAQSEQMAYA